MRNHFEPSLVRMLLANGKEPRIVQGNLLIQGISWKPCKLVEQHFGKRTGINKKHVWTTMIDIYRTKPNIEGFLQVYHVGRFFQRFDSRVDMNESKNASTRCFFLRNYCNLSKIAAKVLACGASYLRVQRNKSAPRLQAVIADQVVSFLGEGFHPLRGQPVLGETEVFRYTNRANT